MTNNLKNNLIEKLTQSCLRNPLVHGQALRSLVYPQEIFRYLECPKHWADKDNFLAKIHLFLPRFIIHYSERDNEQWCISTIESSELKGEGIEELFKLIAPSKEGK